MFWRASAPAPRNVAVQGCESLANDEQLKRKPMRIRIICPAPRRSRHGNRTTALRWARILRDLGHRVTIEAQYQGAACDLMIALHARRSAESMALFERLHPELPLVLGLTGTDVYQDIYKDPDAQRSLELANRLVALQPLAREEVPVHLREKVRVIFQSAKPTPGGRGPSTTAFNVSVVGHLRPVKDPFRLAMAARLLPKSSRIRVLHVGGAMSEEMANRAHTEMERNPRYHWMGELPRWRTRRVMARSQLMVLTSRLEGGANVISEALVDSVPVIASRIPGSVGILGPEYPGYFPRGDTRELARLIVRAETDAAFLNELREWCSRLAPHVHPALERDTWEDLLRELVPGENRPASAPTVPALPSSNRTLG